MDKLIIFNCILLLIIFIVLFISKKCFKTYKSKYIILLISSILTILCHYSTFIYLLLINGESIEYLKTNPNLLLPIYPCNVVMWLCLLYGIIKNKNSKLTLFLADYLFWFGIFSTLVGMFANVDFINNPTFKDYEVTKSIVAHATLLLNVLLIYTFGYIKIDLIKNLKHIVISVIMMYFIGLYCNKIFEVLVSPNEAYNVNSMFILHSPFPDVKFLTYPIIAVVSLVLYFILFLILDIFTYDKDNRWYKRISKKI